MNTISTFYLKSLAFWFVLLVIAFTNATIRELTYKPLLTTYIGDWAHQISSVTAIVFFYIAIYFFLKKLKNSYTKAQLISSGLTWVVMTITFESFMNMYFRKLSFGEMLETYHFWNGETWVFVLISLVVMPVVIDSRIKRK